MFTASIAWVIVIAAAGSCSQADRGPSFSPEQQRLLALDYAAFDQTTGDGWRPWADRGDFAAAARMLDRYAELHDDLNAPDRRMVRFHAGQMYASLENRSTAIERFRGAFDPDEPPDAPFRWNAYVRGTIAFLARDLDALRLSHRELVEQGELEMRMPDGTVVKRTPNLDVLERFIEHFDDTYRDAYSRR